MRSPSVAQATKQWDNVCKVLKGADCLALYTPNRDTGCPDDVFYFPRHSNAEEMQQTHVITHVIVRKEKQRKKNERDNCMGRNIIS